MAYEKSPFVTKEIECPACKQDWEQRFFRKRLFIPEKQEADQHVLQYKWLVDNVRQVHPPYYFLWFCPHCGYADTTDEFANPFETIAGPHTLKLFKRAGRDSVVLQMLAQHLDYEEIGYESAVDLHLLAIYIHSQTPEDLRDVYKLGRLYLRLAWLYREQAAGGVEAMHTAAAQPALTDETEEDTPHQLLSVIEAMQMNLQAMAGPWEDLMTLVQARIREIAQDPERFTGANPYPLCLMAIKPLFAKQEAELQRLKEMCVKDVTGVLWRPQQAKGLSDADAQAVALSHKTLLKQVKRMWDGCPLTEQEALEQAIAHYQLALAGDSRFDNVQNHARVSELLIELMTRCDNFAGAYEMVQGMYRSASETRQQVQARLKGHKDLKAQEKRQLEGHLKRASDALERAADLREELLERMLEHDMPRIKQVLAGRGAEPNGLKEALLNAGVLPEVARLIAKPNSPVLAQLTGGGQT